MSGLIKQQRVSQQKMSSRRMLFRAAMDVVIPFLSLVRPAEVGGLQGFLSMDCTKRDDLYKEGKI